MSATLKAGNFRNYFDKSRRAELNIPGRNFPVDIIHASPYTFGYSPVIDSNYCEMAIAKVKEVHTQERNTPGDILLFMTGEEVKFYFLSDQAILRLIVCTIFTFRISKMSVMR
jgi:HrpA-like RNA helicase